MRERSREKSLKGHGKAALRASITFPRGLYESLEEIVNHKSVTGVGGANLGIVRRKGPRHRRR